MVPGTECSVRDNCCHYSPGRSPIIYPRALGACQVTTDQPAPQSLHLPVHPGQGSESQGLTLSSLKASVQRLLRIFSLFSVGLKFRGLVCNL